MQKTLTQTIRIVQNPRPARSVLRLLAQRPGRLAISLFAFACKEIPLWFLPVVTAEVIDLVANGGEVSGVLFWFAIAAALLLDIAADFEPAVVGAAVDTFHIWWDPDVLASIARAGREGRIATYQVCDWKTPLPADVLLSRHYPGDGVIDFASLTTAVEATGYDRDIEVEIFNEQIWATEPRLAVERTIAGFAASVSPHLRTRVAH